MPRFGSVCEESVWRVPKLTSVAIVCLSCASLTGAMIARSFASVAEGGGAAAIKAMPLTAINLRIRLSRCLSWGNWHLLVPGSRGAPTQTAQT